MDTSIRSRWSAALIVSLSVTAAGCGGKNTMASRSAAAFEEAKRKGVSLGGSAHGGHAAGTAHDQGSSDHSKMAGMSGSSMKGMDHSKMPGMSGSGTSGMDHSKMAGMSGSNMKGMDHLKMPGMSGSSMGGMDHSKMAGTSGSGMKGMDHSKMPGMSGMDHSKMPGMSGSSMKGMDHSKMPAMSGVQHGGMSEMSQSPQALPDEPAATLRPDPLDAPALTSVVDAQRSAEMAGMMASGEHAMMSHGTYVHQDAGRDEVRPPGQMDHTAPAQTMPQRQQQSKPAARAPAVPRNETFYTCPMHPEIRSSAPGQCPKCGMALVRKAAK